MVEQRMDLENLRKWDGRDENLPVYIGVKGVIFDVSSRRDLYGPGGTYAMFAGKEISRALAIGSTKLEDCVGDIQGLSESAISSLESWLSYFEKKYPVVARLQQ